MISIRYFGLAFCLVLTNPIWAQNSTPAGAAPTSPSSPAASPTPPAAPTNTSNASDEALRAAQGVQTNSTAAGATAPSNGTTTPGVVAPGGVVPGVGTPGATLPTDPKNAPVLSYGEKDTACKKSLRTDFQFASKPFNAKEDDAKNVKVARNPELEKKRIEFLKDKIRKDPKNILLIVRLAKEFFDQGEFDKTALLLWKQIDKIETKDMLLLAQAHEKLKQKVELRKVTEIIIGKDEKNGAAHYFMAKSYDPKNEKEKDAYKSNLVKSLELDPKNKIAMFALAEYYLNQNNVFEAKTLYSDSLKVLKNDPEVMTKYCEAVSLDSAHNETKTVCRDAMRLSPDIPENYVYFGISFKEQDKWDEAHKWFQTAVEKFPDSEFALICLAESQAQRNDYIGTYTSYRAASEIDPDSERALLGFAKAAFAIKKIPESLDSFKKLCRKNRKYSSELKKVILDLKKSAQKSEVSDFEVALRRCGGFF